jgi:hypothetical protein
MQNVQDSERCPAKGIQRSNYRRGLPFHLLNPFCYPVRLHEAKPGQDF